VAKSAYSSIFRDKSVYKVNSFYVTVLRLRCGVASSDHRKSLGRESQGHPKQERRLSFFDDWLIVTSCGVSPIFVATR
jgi:hypothetical protein